MRRIEFLGKSTRDKQILMLYIGKVLSSGGRVLLKTSDSILQQEMGHFHYNDDYVVSDEERAYDSYDYVLVDLNGVEETLYEFRKPVEAVKLEGKSDRIHKTVFVSGCTLAEVKENERFNGLLDESIFIIFQNMLYDTDINVRYLTRRYGIDNRHSHIAVQYINERDMAIHLENEYDSSLRLKDLSRDNHRLIMSLVCYIADTDRNTHKQWLKTALRRG